MSFRESVSDIVQKSVNVLHRGVITISGGRIGNRIGALPVVELHTIGRVSGKRRSTMLTSPIHDDGTYVIVASKGGDDRDPDWYRNLVADPDIELTVSGATSKFTARTASPSEKQEMWPKIVAGYKGYAGYQAKTTRDIPVVICEPKPA